MGNVLASSAPSAAVTFDKGNLAMPGTKTPLAPLVEKVQKLENPGCLEDVHKKCKDVQAMPFEGAKVMLNKGLSNHFQVSHTINMCGKQPGGYRFGTTYVGTKQYSSTEAYPVLLGDIDPAGNLNANIIHQFNQRIRCKFGSQIQDNKMAATQMTTDYRGDDFTASLTVGNPNIFNGSGVFVGHFLQSVTHNLALGSELAFQYGPNVPGGMIAVVSAVGRYKTADSVWSGTLGPGGIHVCYYKRASEQLQIGVELETSLRMQESTATLAYQADLPKADLVFRGTVDSNWNVCGVLEKRLQPLPFSFALCGRLNHNKNDFRMGCGLIIG